MKQILAAAALIMICAEPAGAVLDRLAITPEEHAACDDDAAKFCSAAYPDENKMISCMRSNRNQLSPVCLATFKAGMIRRHLAM